MVWKKRFPFYKDMPHTYFSKIIVGDDLWCHTVQHTANVFIFDSKENESCEVVYVNPRQKLLAAADAATKPKVERQKHIFYHPSPAAQHSAWTNNYLWGSGERLVWKRRFLVDQVGSLRSLNLRILLCLSCTHVQEERSLCSLITWLFIFKKSRYNQHVLRHYSGHHNTLFIEIMLTDTQTYVYDIMWFLRRKNGTFIRPLHCPYVCRDFFSGIGGVIKSK